jgi:hypothetical protein
LKVKRLAGGLTFESAVELNEEVSPEVFLAHVVKDARAEYHHLDHVLHDPQNLLIILVREGRLEPECTRGLELLDLRNATSYRDGVVEGSSLI